MIDTNRLKGYSGELPPNEPPKKDTPLDPEKFKKVLKVEESEQSQQRNQRNRKKTEEEGEEILESTTPAAATPPAGFSGLMQPSTSTSIFAPQGPSAPPPRPSLGGTSDASPPSPQSSYTPPPSFDDSYDTSGDYSSTVYTPTEDGIPYTQTTLSSQSNIPSSDSSSLGNLGLPDQPLSSNQDSSQNKNPRSDSFPTRPVYTQTKSVKKETQGGKILADKGPRSQDLIKKSAAKNVSISIPAPKPKDKTEPSKEPLPTLTPPSIEETSAIKPPLEVDKDLKSKESKMLEEHPTTAWAPTSIPSKKDKSKKTTTSPTLPSISSEMEEQEHPKISALKPSLPSEMQKQPQPQIPTSKPPLPSDMQKQPQGPISKPSVSLETQKQPQPQMPISQPSLPSDIQKQQPQMLPPKPALGETSIIEPPLKQVTTLSASIEERSTELSDLPTQIAPSPTEKKELPSKEISSLRQNIPPEAEETLSKLTTVTPPQSLAFQEKAPEKETNLPTNIQPQTLQEQAPTPSEKPTTPPFQAPSEIELAQFTEQNIPLPQTPKEKISLPSTPKTLETSSIKSIDEESSPLFVSPDQSTALQKEKQPGSKKDEDTTQAISQISTSALPTNIAALHATLPVYAQFSNDFFELFQKMVGVMTIEQYGGKTVTTLMINNEHSIFNGAEIVIDHYSTAPNSFNIELIGSEAAVNLFNDNAKDLVAAFQLNKTGYDVGMVKASLRTTESRMHRRKDSSGDGSSDSNSRNQG